MNNNEGDGLGWTIACLAFIPIDIFVDGFATSYVWNNVIAKILSITTINFWQALIISLTISFFGFKPKINKEKTMENRVKLLFQNVFAYLVFWGSIGFLLHFVEI